MPGAGPGRVHNSVRSACAKKTPANGSGGGKEGQFWGLFRQQQPRWVGICAEARLPGSSWWWEQPLLLPGGALGTRVALAAQQSAAMRSQGSVRSSPGQGPEWVGRGGRKVLRIWVSG